MDIEIQMENNQLETLDKLEIDKTTFQKMSFIYNALETGWSIKKRNDSYIFTKSHEKKKEIFKDSYLSIFMKENLNINNAFK
jgi:hypothetical protein